MILRARLVLPINQPPISDGAVVIRGSRIMDVGPWRSLRTGPSKPVDLGDCVLLPGLVNAHCHLDYTHMAGEIPPPKSFTEWLKVIVSTKACWTLADYQKSWAEGAAMLLRTGTTTVADIEAVPELLPHAWHRTPLNVISFLEMLGITQKRPLQVVLGDALRNFQRLKRGGTVAFSPHAPYSTFPELLKASARAARKLHCLVSVHVAESNVEYTMFTKGRGEMFEWLQRSGRDNSDCGRGTPVTHLARHGLLGKNVIAVHANHLSREDHRLLSKTQTSVAHCPRSHSYFRHKRFELTQLVREGVNVCLGTDSLASVFKKRHDKIELSMFAEMQELARHRPGLSPKRILELATVNGARALGLAGRIGELSAGAFADVIAIPFAGKTSQAFEAVLHHKGAVPGSMIRGRWELGPEWQEAR